MHNPNKQLNILISACLLGNPVRYNGTDLLIEDPLLKGWQQQGRLISICPEVAGGLPTPRAPAEIITPKKVMNNKQQNVSKAFFLGSDKTLQLAQENNCVAAIMTENSPSCGSHFIYDGSFTSTKISGMGITAELLEKHGIKVFNQFQLNELKDFLEY